MKHLVILGTGGFARVLYGYSKRSIGYGKEWDIRGYLGGDIPTRDDEMNKLNAPFLGYLDSYEIQENDVFTCAVGNPAFKKKLVVAAVKKGANFISIIHETAIIQDETQIGKAVIFCPYTVINANATIGDYVMLNSNSTIGHDAVIGDYACIMGQVGIMGFASIGKETFIGTGAMILPQAHVGKNAYIGSGSVVLRSVKDNTEVFGNPAVRIGNISSDGARTLC